MGFHSQIRDKVAALPDKPGCYLMRDRRGTIIYIGKALSLRKRLQGYFRLATLRRAAPKLRSMLHSVTDFDILVVRSEAEALITEGNLIKQHRPRFNIVLRDDKSYLSLRLDINAPVPRLTTCRMIRDDQALYFGPFPSAAVVRSVLDFTEKRFGLRKCAPVRPDAETHQHCHNDILRFCSAPCIGRISLEDYRLRVDEASAFLRGERLEIITEVKEQMKQAAGKHDFEKAAVLRDTWLALCAMVRQRISTTRSPVIKAAEALEGIAALRTKLQLKVVPSVIDCFDVSNLFGTHSVASMVTAIDGQPDRRFYRRFNIRSVGEGGDDPRSIQEVVQRHYQRAVAEQRRLPDLIVVDGGITQLRAARVALHEVGVGEIPSVGLAEEMETLVFDDGREPLILPRNSTALRVLIQLRDEAHRFAVESHRRLRSRIIRESVLDEIPGIGPAKKAALLKHFGSVYRLARADATAVAEVPGIGLQMAEDILRVIGGGGEVSDK